MANNLPEMLKSEAIKTRFNEVKGKNAAAFMSALLSVWNGSPQLQACDERSILGAAGLAATLNLSITPSLGQAYIVPFKGKATFQVGVRGLVQLAHRTGKYAALHAGKVCEGEISGFNPVTGEPIIGEKISDTVVGYVAYMRLTNGFEKTLYMTKDEIEAHAQRYSQSYSYDKRSGKKSSPWSTNFDAMASKTVLKRLLNAWGILSADMAEAIQSDQAVVDKNTITYVDNGGDVAGAQRYRSRHARYRRDPRSRLDFRCRNGRGCYGGSVMSVPRLKKSCAWCGAAFFGTKRHKYCSEECYTEAHRKQVRERSRVRYANNPEQERARRREYHRKNREADNAYVAAWHRQHPNYRRNWELARKEAATNA